jgi:hypothetical protein
MSVDIYEKTPEAKMLPLEESTPHMYLLCSCVELALGVDSPSYQHFVLQQPLLCKLVMYGPHQESSSETDMYVVVGTNRVFMLSSCVLLYTKQPCEDVYQSNKNKTYV